jgi:DivIVA domain-containing protein
MSDIDRELSEFFKNPPPQVFEVVLRGYRRRQVDEYLKRLKSDPATVNEQPLFDVVFRGYNRIQVREYLHSLGCQPPP